ncbi:hypothetical protein GYA49_03210 [Candidatus Beckwithbacteria bacterium]|nr:hypothetical protein [Candidatus Beckwithbacteria bacterium]
MNFISLLVAAVVIALLVYFWSSQRGNILFSPTARHDIETVNQNLEQLEQKIDTYNQRYDKLIK